MTQSSAPVPTILIAGVPDVLPDDMVVLDVREQDEWDAGHIDGAVHLPLSELVARADDVPTARMLVVCKVGGRSGQAAGWLAQRGHDVVNLDGGMLDWEAAGRAMVSENGRPPTVV